MILSTETFFWTPLYAILIFFVIKTYGKSSIWILLGVAITILLCDRITTGFMKPFFGRLRPSHEPELEGLLHLVDGYRGGLYGFASSHAANTFGVAIFIWLSLKKHYKWVGLIFIWAIVMTYTRIYLGVHYPTDILVGAIIGLLCGWLSAKSSLWMLKNKPLTEKQR
ncbi:MAG: phosphatase PAP2 family protein [Cytophagales bacterium]|nr:phosphatase PAP2 family protein [Cytophagales bacterium]MCA6387938.1 phosphatase PAP2 family protein [Cytophagales bacterium]MCA6391018.1 phosphatase PAP2 family protein [Cytophagales bacterium]MCA6394595.1 phosphatase PAP2 family protein [Cytophagales bacterium]MCA6398306.1 phosphatase PAP2 family protein [Cytophagales bacterium]